MEQRKFSKNIFSKLPRLPLIVLAAFLFIAVTGPILSNEKPVLLIQHGHFSFPAFSNDPYTTIHSQDGSSKSIRTDNIRWDTLREGFVLMPLIPYSAGKSDLNNSNFKSPFEKQFTSTTEGIKELSFRNRHLLGTGNLGNDLLAGLIEGTRISLIIGICSMIIALLIGILLGLLSGYYGNSLLKLKRISAILILLLLLPAWFYFFELRSYSIQQSFDKSILIGTVNVLISLSGLLIFIILPVNLISRVRFPDWFNKQLFVPVDAIINRIIELFLSLPRIVVLITFALIFRPSVLSVILIIGLTSWTSIARMVRALVMSQRDSGYIDAGRSIGMPGWRLFLFHLLPSTFSQLKVFLIYGVASAILAETGLSFLGIGVPQGIVTWGQLLYEGKENVSAWWLILFPGLCIFLLLASLNTLADRLEKSEN